MERIDSSPRTQFAKIPRVDGNRVRVDRLLHVGDDGGAWNLNTGPSRWPKDKRHKEPRSARYAGKNTSPILFANNPLSCTLKAKDIAKAAKSAQPA